MKLSKNTITFLVLIAIFISSFFIRQRVILMALGFSFVLIGIWLIPSLTVEIALFGAVFSLVEWWKYWGVSSFGLTPFPDSVYIFTSTFIAVWIVFVLINVASMFIPFLIPFNTWLRKPLI